MLIQILITILIIWIVVIIVVITTKSSDDDDLENDTKTTYNKFYKGALNWKYITGTEEIDCLTHWDYYDSDKKKIIASGINTTTTIDKRYKWCATKYDTLPVDRIEPTASSIIYDNWKLIVGIAIEMTVPVMIRTIMSQIIPKLIKTLSRGAVMQVGIQVQVKSIVNISKSLSRNPSTIRNLSKSIASTFGRLSGRTGMKMSTRLLNLAKSLRPGPLILFDVLSITLDLLDAGGYNQMQTKKVYYETKSQSETEQKRIFFDAFKEECDAQNIPFSLDDFQWPLVYNPLIHDVDDEKEKEIEAKMTEILSDPNHPLTKSMFDQIIADIESGVLKESDMENVEAFDKYYEPVMDAIMNIVYDDEWCRSKGGSMNDDKQCIISEGNCNVWPVEEGKQYREFKDGKCVIADPTVRSLCESQNLEYDIKTGICKIDANYCKSKGAEYKFDSKLKENDCVIPISQEIMEGIFGTTVIRGLKYAFGGGNEAVEHCGYDGRIMTNDKCLRTANNSLSSGTKLEIWDCDLSDYTPKQKWFYDNRDQSLRPMEDYNMCVDIPSGNTTSGTQPQLIKCNNTLNQKFVYNIANKQLKPKNDQTQCFHITNTKNGTKISLQKCRNESAQRFELKQNLLHQADGNCWYESSRPADCPATYTNNGLTCGRSADTKSSSAGRGAYVPASCPTGYKNMGATCFRDYKSFTRDSYNCVGEKCMGPCDDKYRGPGDPWPCSKDAVGARAYPKCSAEARYLKKPFASEYHSGGAFCALDAKTLPGGNAAMVCPSDYPIKRGGLCYIDCEKKYGPGYINTGVSCFRGVSTLGMGSLICKSHETKSGEICNKKCPPGYSKTNRNCARYMTTQPNADPGAINQYKLNPEAERRDTRSKYQ